jgi:hypothetical protein
VQCAHGVWRNSRRISAGGADFRRDFLLRSTLLSCSPSRSQAFSIANVIEIVNESWNIDPEHTLWA